MLEDRVDLVSTNVLEFRSDVCIRVGPSMIQPHSFDSAFIFSRRIRASWIWIAHALSRWTVAVVVRPFARCRVFVVPEQRAVALHVPDEEVHE